MFAYVCFYQSHHLEIQIPFPSGKTKKEKHPKQSPQPTPEKNDPPGVPQPKGSLGCALTSTENAQTEWVNRCEKLPKDNDFFCMMIMPIFRSNSSCGSYLPKVQSRKKRHIDGGRSCGFLKTTRHHRLKHAYCDQRHKEHCLGSQLICHGF